MITILLSVLMSSGAMACDQVFWGTVEYVDQKNNGDLVEKTELFQIREWSAQQQFKRLLIEKSDLKANVEPISISAGAKSVNQSLSLKDWSENSDYLEVVGLDMHSLEGLQKVSIQYGECVLEIPIMDHH